jgi:subtilisin family serine protease
MHTQFKAKVFAYTALFSIFFNIFAPFASVFNTQAHALEQVQEASISLTIDNNSLNVSIPTKQTVSYVFAYQTKEGQTEVAQGTNQSSDADFNRELTIGTCSSTECVLQAIERGIFKYQISDNQVEAVLFTIDNSASKVNIVLKTTSEKVELTDTEMTWLQKGELGSPTSSPSASPVATLEATSSAEPEVLFDYQERSIKVGDKVSTNRNLNYTTDEVLVKFRNQKINLQKNSFIDQAKLSLLTVTNGLEVKETISSENVSVLKIKGRESVEEMITKLKKDDNIDIAQPNYQYKHFAIPSNDTYRSNLWGLDNVGQTVDGSFGTSDADIDAPEAWNYSQGSNSVVVAVIDSGVDYNHPDLTPNMWDGTSCVSDSGSSLGACNHGYDYENNDKTPLPDNNTHGTHVAGTIAAAKNNNKGIVGVAPDVKIMAVKVGFPAATSDLIKAVNFAKQNGAKVINASFGGYVYDNLFRSAISSFPGLFIAAAGNDANNNDNTPAYPCSYDLNNIVCVAATTQTDSLAIFSNYGATNVDIAAPGTSIFSTTASFTQTHFEETLESVTPPAMPNGWTKTGYWGTYAAEPAWGNVLYSDAYYYPYLSNQSTYATSNTANLGGASAAKISLWTACDTEYTNPSSDSSDYIALEISANGTSFAEILRWNEYLIDGDGDPNNGIPVYYIENLNIPAQYLTSNFKLRFHWVTNGSNSGTKGDGCRVDDIRIDKYIYTSAETYDFMDGTSMATPHVSGVAALALSYKPTLSTSEVKNAILQNGDALTILDGKVATGKRLNANNTLKALAPTNSAPVANAQSVTTPEDTAKTITLSATDANGDTLSYIIVNGPSKGSLSSIFNTNQVTYTPNANYNGSDSFTFKANDGKVDSNLATVSITVTATNDAPVLQAIGDKNVNELTNLTFTASATDADGDQLTYSLIGAPQGATINASTGVFNFTPTEAQGPGTYTFKVRVTDGTTPVSQDVTVTVYEVNIAPVASDQQVTLEENSNISISLQATDNDFPANTLYYNIITGTMHGTLSSVNGNQVTYSPTAHFNGSDSFTFKVFDGVTDSNIATVNITVNPVNYAPVLIFIPNQNIDELQTLLFQATASDSDNDVLTYSLSNAPEGMAINGNTGLVAFTPTEAQGPGTYYPTIVVSDGIATDSQQVTVVVNEVNVAPSVDNIEVTTNEDTPVQISVNASDTDIPAQSIAFGALTAPSYGTIQYSSITGFTYTPYANYNGTDSFTYSATDGISTSNTGIITITVKAVNDAPIAIADNFTIAEDSYLSKHQSEFLANDNDEEGGIHITSVSNPINGNVNFSAGYVTFTPNANFNGTAGFDYTISDGEFVSTAHVTVNVTAVNDAPVALTLDVSLFENTSKTITLNATDVDGDILTYLIVSQPQHGSLIDLSGNSLIYTPDTGYIGKDSFTFAASDGQSSSNTAVVSITVFETNDPPVLDFVPDKTVNEQETLNFILTASDPEGKPLSYGLQNAPEGMSVNPSTGEVLFTPTENQGGTIYTITYTVTDGFSEDSQAGLVTVYEVNQIPVADNVTITTNEDTVTEVTLNGSDSDIPTQIITYYIVSNPSHGSLTAIVGNKLSYTPDTNWHGTDSFSYRVYDGFGFSANATVTVTVSAINDSPVLATVPPQQVDELTTLSFTVVASDIDGDTISYSLTDQPAGMSIDPSSGLVTFTPTEAQGPNTYKVTIIASDGTVQISQEVTITVYEVNVAPVASNVETATNEDEAVLVMLSATDSDNTNQILSYFIASQPQHGTLGTISGNTVVYTPHTDYHGPDSFVYYANDGVINSANANVNLTVFPINDAPLAMSDSVSTQEDTVVNILISALLSNDTDVDGDALSLIEVSNPTHGTVSLMGETITFTPEANYYGQAQFNYTISDGKATSTGLVLVTIPAVNDAPVATDSAVETQEDISKGIVLQASDIDSQALSYTIISGPVRGMLSAISGNSVTYTPINNFAGMDSFRFKTSDGELESNEATVTISVQAVNDAPVAIQDAFETDEDTKLIITKESLLSNDTDIDSMSLYLTAVSNPIHGTVRLGETEIEFMPSPDYFGTAGFDYIVSDGQDSSTGHVIVTVKPMPDAPVALDQDVVVTKNTTASITLSGTDPDGDTLHYTVITEPSMGLLSGIAPNLTYAPTLDYTGTDSLTFKVSDGTYESNEATVTITVKDPEQKEDQNSSNSGVGGNSDSNSTASAPVCNDTKPDRKPTLYTASTLDETSIVLHWSKVSSATDYLISYGTQSGKEQYGVSSVGGANVTSYTISQLQPGTVYYFRVKAVRGCMPGEYSNEVSANTWGSAPASDSDKVLGTGTYEQAQASESATAKKTETTQKSTRRINNILFPLLFGLIGIPALFVWRRRKN